MKMKVLLVCIVLGAALLSVGWTRSAKEQSQTFMQLVHDSAAQAAESTRASLDREGRLLTSVLGAVVRSNDEVTALSVSKMLEESGAWTHFRVSVDGAPIVTSASFPDLPAGSGALWSFVVVGNQAQVYFFGEESDENGRSFRIEAVRPFSESAFLPGDLAGILERRGQGESAAGFVWADSRRELPAPHRGVGAGSRSAFVTEGHDARLWWNVSVGDFRLVGVVAQQHDGEALGP